ncbi:hypothetical protein WJX81_004310 [Elliptochloris bilobata]|uniref:EamA domain-containing protein n=1 Tax=Elliptochloris bilobata TaxID=381761 RepID=A0AAW1QX44_9CHLO
MNFVSSLATGAVNVAWSTVSLPARVVFGERKESNASPPEPDSTEEERAEGPGGAFEESDTAAGEAEEAPDLEAPLLVASEGARSDEKPALPAPPVDRSLLGLGLYALSGCFLSTMLMLSKKLNQLNIPVFEVLLARSVFLLVFALAGCALHRKSPFGKRRSLLTIRGIFGYGAIMNYLIAVIMLPLNDAMVLTFTAPIWAAILSPIVIKEQPSRATFFAILLCMGGVTLISRPSFLGFLNDVQRPYLGVFFALFQALCSAMAKMCVRELRTEDPSVSVFYLALVSTIAATIGCSLPASVITPPPGMSLLGFVVPRNMTETAMLVGVGLTSYGSQICMTISLRHVKAAPALAMSYLSIVLTVAYGFFIFDEVPTPYSVAGAVLILASTAFLGIFVRRQQVAHQPHAAYAPLPAGPSDASRPAHA